MTDIETWGKLEKGKTNKGGTKKAIDSIISLASYTSGISSGVGKRIATVDTDEGIAVAWRRGSKIRHLLIVSDPDGAEVTGFSILERGIDGVGRGGFPRGIVAKIDKLYDLLDAQLNGHPGRERTALRKLMQGGPIEQARIEYEAAVERDRKHKKKKKKKRI